MITVMTVLDRLVDGTNKAPSFRRWFAVRSLYIHGHESMLARRDRRAMNVIGRMVRHAWTVPVTDDSASSLIITAVMASEASDKGATDDGA